MIYMIFKCDTRVNIHNTQIHEPYAGYRLYRYLDIARWRTHFTPVETYFLFGGLMPRTLRLNAAVVSSFWVAAGSKFQALIPLVRGLLSVLA